MLLELLPCLVHALAIDALGLVLVHMHIELVFCLFYVFENFLFSKISHFREPIWMEHIESKNSWKSKLQIEFLCSVRIRSRKWDLIEIFSLCAISTKYKFLKRVLMDYKGSILSLESELQILLLRSIRNRSKKNSEKIKSNERKRAFITLLQMRHL